MLRLDVLVFALLLISFAWFGHSQPGWNVNSRLALAMAMAETGRPRVDRYVTRPGLETRDLASYGGHLYSDKSLGASLLAVPAVWAVQGLENLASTTFSTAIRRYLVTLLSVGLCGTLAGVLLMRWLAAVWGVPRFQAALPAVGVMLGSMLFLYGTLLMSYMPATLFLLAALLALQTATRRKSVGWFALAGLLAGLCVLCEYLYGVAVALAGIFAWAQCGWKRGVPGMVAYGTGGLAGLAPFFIYTISIFGTPAIPYDYHLMPEFRAAMARGLMGATWPPRLSVLWLITFHPFRGIFVYSPLLFLGCAGLLKLLIHPGKEQADDGLKETTPPRSLALLCIACILFYLLFNSAYYMWWGGWSFSPRHLAPAVPFMAAGLGVWIHHAWGRIALAAAGAVGVAIHLLVNATEPQTPDGGWQAALLQPDLAAYDYPSVFLQHTWPRVVAGAFDWNLGSTLGLRGAWGMVPLLGCWMLLGFAIRRSQDREKRRAARES